MRLYQATRDTLQHWLAVLRARFRDRFPGPGDITAFRDGFAVHGRYRQPCRDCGRPVQRIRYAENETNYCALRRLLRAASGDLPTLASPPHNA